MFMLGLLLKMCREFAAKNVPRAPDERYEANIFSDGEQLNMKCVFEMLAFSSFGSCHDRVIFQWIEKCQNTERESLVF